MKKALSLTLALVMCLGLTAPAFAAEGKTVTTPDGKYTITNVVDEVTLKASGEEAEWVKSRTIYNIYLVPASGAHITPTGVKETDEAWYNYLAVHDGVLMSEDGGEGLWDTGEWFSEASLWEERLNVEEAYFHDGIGDLFGVGFADNYTVFIGFVKDDYKPEQPADPQPTTPTDPEPTDPEPTNPPDAPAYQVSNWAKDRVAVAVEAGLAADSLGNDYRVNITRAQFAATAVKLYEAMSGEKAEATGESSFTDTDDAVILLAADMGFVSGVGGGKFSPEALVTREQAAVMLSSVFTKLGGEIPAVEATTFADDGDVAGWARNAVAFMNSKEIVTGVGDNSFSPKGNASIEQALLIALKMSETLK